jgi:hypothetical protein
MFNLNFDICLVPFHAILTEITVFKLKQTFLEPPIISWKGPIKTNWTILPFSCDYCSISGLVWRDQLFWVQTLLKEISTRESSSSWLGQVYVRFTIWESFVKRLLQHAATWNSKLNDPKFFRLYDFTGNTLLRCIRAGGHAFTDKYKRLFLTTSANVLTIKYNASQHKLLHVV